MESKPNTQLRVALYARVSTEEQRQGLTIESQVAALEKVAQERAWTVSGRYLDNGWNWELARPELDRLRDDAPKGLFDAVLVNDVDRLAREVTHIGIIRRDLERHRIRLIFSKLPDNDDPTTKLMVNILGSFAEFEREMIKDRTRRGMRGKVELRKQYAGCVAPYGYVYRRGSLTGGKGILEVNDKEATVVKQIFEWASSEGLSLQKLADRLTRLQVPTPKGKRIWQACTVCKILHNETYVGIWSYGKATVCEPIKRRNQNRYHKRNTSRRFKPQSEWIRIELPEEFRIIDRAQWDKVQHQIALNPKLSPRNAKFRYLLQGLVRCQFCKRVFSGTYCKERGKTYVYYRCTGRCAESRWIRRDLLDKVVWERIKQALLKPEHLVARVRAALKRIAEEGAQIVQRDRDVTLSELEGRQQAMMKEYQSGALTVEQFMAGLRSLDDLKSQLMFPKEASIVLSERKIQEIVSRGREAVLKNLQAADFENKRHVLGHLIKTVFVGRGSAKIVGALASEEIEQPVDQPSVFAFTPLWAHTGKRGTLEFELFVDFPGARQPV